MLNGKRQVKLHEDGLNLQKRIRRGFFRKLAGCQEE